MTKRVQKVAVLGAGVMGAQIAAHLANCKVDVVLFELAGKEQDKSLPAKTAIANLLKLKPAPFASPSLAKLVAPANYDEDLNQLADCDLIIEAIAERMNWKQDLYKKIAKHVGEDTVLASNTSGLGINKLCAVLPQKLQKNFLGVHFFNPPRYMHLVELIPAQTTDPEILNWLEPFFVSTLGKGVVFAKDTANFVGNRIGVFSLLSTMYHAEQFKIGFEVVDQLTGKVLGRPKSATYRTADVVGLDTMALVVNTMRDYLPDDPWHEFFVVPEYLYDLIGKGALGQKTGAGFYKNRGKQVFSLETNDYVAADGKISAEVQQIISERDMATRMQALRDSDDPQAKFLWAIHRDLFHYCCYCLADIAHTARDIDFAMRWGYGWKQGPFEIMQAAGFKDTIAAIGKDIAGGSSMSDCLLPEWTTNLGSIHNQQGSYSVAKDEFVSLSPHPVYQRQQLREDVFGAQQKQQFGETIVENDGARLWHEGDKIAVLSLKTKLHTVDDTVLESIMQACAIAEQDFDALVVWSPDAPFSAGANLLNVANQVKNKEFDLVDKMIINFQAAAMRLKHSAIPTVAAVNNLALGGGCEFQMHCNRTVASLESYMGLVEAGVGLLPAGGGVKEMALRSMQFARGGDIMPHLQTAFNAIAMGTVSSSAQHAFELGLLAPTDIVIANAHELLHVAKAEAKAMVESGFRAPIEHLPIKVGGKTAKATLMMMAVNMLEGNFISEHDYEIAGRIADTLCGGEVEAGAEVSANWLLSLERKHFVELLSYQKTLDRIEYMLKNNRPLRN